MADAIQLANEAELLRNVETAMGMLNRGSCSWVSDFVLKPFVADNNILNDGFPNKDDIQAPGDAAGDMAILANARALEKSACFNIMDLAKPMNPAVAVDADGIHVVCSNVDLTLIPAWSMDGITVGGTMQRVKKTTCPISGRDGPRTFALGRFAFNERTGEMLCISNTRPSRFDTPVPKKLGLHQSPPVHIAYLRHDSPVERFHVYALCDPSIFAARQFADSVLMLGAMDHIRPSCLVCGMPSIHSCGCDLQLVPPSSNLDFSSFLHNANTHAGAWDASIRYIGRDLTAKRLVRTRLPGKGNCIHHKGDEIITALKSMAIQSCLESMTVRNAVQSGERGHEAAHERQTLTSCDPDVNNLGCGNEKWDVHVSNSDVAETTLSRGASDSQGISTVGASVASTVDIHWSPYGAGNDGCYMNDLSSGYAAASPVMCAEGYENDGLEWLTGRGDTLCSAGQNDDAGRPVCSLSVSEPIVSGSASACALGTSVGVCDAQPVSMASLSDASAINAGMLGEEPSAINTDMPGEMAARQEPGQASVHEPSAHAAASPKVAQAAGLQCTQAASAAPTESACPVGDAVQARRLDRIRRNRESAARSNAKRRERMLALRADMRQGNERVCVLRAREAELRSENARLKELAALRWKAQAQSTMGTASAQGK